MREIQDIIIWLAFFFWSGFTVFTIQEVGIEDWGAAGMGVVWGVLLKMLSDMWQFYHRKSKSE